MKVRCIKNKLRDFEEGPLKNSLKEVIHLDEDEEISLTVGAIYTVYGMTFNFHDGMVPFYYICNDTDLPYATPKAAVFFEVVDPRPSQFWEFIFDYSKNQEIGFNFPEWIKEKFFYSNLLDGEAREKEIFLKYKKLMDDEFLDKKSVLESNLKTCRVCGNKYSDFQPWGDDGKTPSFALCNCCGTQFGYEDCELSSIRKMRSDWIANGARWFEPNEKPLDWSLEKSLENIPEEFK
jgi:hypothetical protein